jgi:hypothetical protein
VECALNPFTNAALAPTPQTPTWLLQHVQQSASKSVQGLSNEQTEGLHQLQPR